MRRLFSLAAMGALACFGAAGPAVAFDPASTIGLYGHEPLPAERAMSLPGLSLTRAYIPDQVDFSHLMPPPVQQTGASCVAFSIGYAARGYYSRLEAAERGEEAAVPSPARLHARIRRKDKPCEVGGSHELFAYAALTEGAIDRRTVPDEETCAGAEHYTGPLDPRFAITGAAFLYTTARDGALTQRHLDLIKQQLARGHPVVVGLNTYRAPNAEPNGPVTTLALLQSDEVYSGTLAPHGEAIGGHAMVAVGYDERRRALLVQNSWGPGWADGGFGWIGYDALFKDLTDASVMRVDVEPPRPSPGLQERGPNIYSFAANAGLAACSSVKPRGKGPDGKVRLTGFVSTVDELDRLDALGTYDTADIAVRPYPVCEAMKTLEEPMDSPLAPEVYMLDGITDLEFGDSLAFEVITPSVPSFLYLVYLDASGTAVNLAPRFGAMRDQYQPFTRLVFGDGGPGAQTFTASPPAGGDRDDCLVPRG
ncbi:MAG: C1 family peptidase, partial [Pseudomonadota bacterium]